MVDGHPSVFEKAVDTRARGLSCFWNGAHSNNRFRLFGDLNDVFSHISRRFLFALTLTNFVIH